MTSRGPLMTLQQGDKSFLFVSTLTRYVVLNLTPFSCPGAFECEIRLAFRADTVLN